MDGIIETLSKKPIRQRIDMAVAERGRAAISADINKFLHVYFQLSITCYILQCEATDNGDDLPSPPVAPEYRTLYSSADLEQTIFNWGRYVMYCQKYALRDDWLRHPLLLRVVRLLATNPQANEFFDWYIGEPLLTGSMLGDVVLQVQRQVDLKDVIV